LDERILLKLKIDISDLFEFEGNIILDYDAELVFESNTNFFLKIFYEPSDKHFKRIMSWDPKYSYSILSKFTVAKVVTPQRLIHVDFCDYFYKGMSSSTTYKEFGKEYFIIRLQGIKLVYEAPEQLESNVYLNHTAFRLIELNYRYHMNFFWKNEEFKFEPINGIKEFIEFGNIKFIPEHNFILNNKSTDIQVNIEKEPRFRIVHSCTTDKEIKDYITVLCDLYSFYTNKKIDWQHSRIYVDGKLFIEIRDTVQEENRDLHGIFIWDFAQNPLNLITNVNPKTLIDNKELVSKLVERFNYALKVGNETKFMILYNILEQLRNHYILTGEIESEKAGNPPNINKVRDEYKFVLGIKKTNEFIKGILKQITEIVDPIDKEAFESGISAKVPDIKLMSMSNQFDNYFKFTNVDPKNYKLDFEELKGLRNKIFHGRHVDDRSQLDKVNWYEHLPKLTGELMIKFFGINDLKTIEKKRDFG
jgi:hypothetical protein